MRVVRPGASPVQEKFVSTRREPSAALVERVEEVDLVLCALVAQEHPLLVGPPGCAKSLLLDALARWLDGRRFTALLTKFSQTEDLFGPVSLKALKEDRYVRVTAGKLPEADLAFLDEVFKGSAAIPSPHSPLNLRPRLSFVRSLPERVVRLSPTSLRVLKSPRT